MQDLLVFWLTLPPLSSDPHPHTPQGRANSAILTHLNRPISLSGGGARARARNKQYVSIFPASRFWAYRLFELLFLNADAFVAFVITRSQPFRRFSMLVSVSRCCRLCCQRYRAFATRLHLFDTFAPCFILPVINKCTCLTKINWNRK
jgi:hypothetical protein